MNYRELSITEAKNLFDTEIKDKVLSNEYYNGLDKNYKRIRADILNLVERPIQKKYEYDLTFALKLYTYFSKENEMFPDFTEAVASNYGFWRYICLKVVPDIIIERHGYESHYFYSKNVRMYIPTLWWYIEMCYQGDLISTGRILRDFNSDFIVQIVERPGSNGMYLDVNRAIIKKLWKYSKNRAVGDKDNIQDLMRRVLVQHTAMSSNYNPIVENNVDEYVNSLFKKCEKKNGK